MSFAFNLVAFSKALVILPISIIVIQLVEVLAVGVEQSFLYQYQGHIKQPKLALLEEDRRLKEDGQLALLSQARLACRFTASHNLYS